MDMTPQGSDGRQIVTGYGDGRIRVSGVAWEQPILVMPEVTVGWGISDLSDLTAESLAAVINHTPGIEILLIGCGPRLVPVPPEIKAALRAAGIASDPMDTGAACRTYNVLVGEGRRVAAGLLPV